MNVFSGWENVDHHKCFTKTKELETYKEILRFVDGFEVRHTGAIDGLRVEYVA